jgi:predicted ferric reductase
MTMNTANDSARRLPLIPATIYKGLIVLCFVVFFGAALAVPFYYETQTLWYKVGAGKVMFRTGQLAGMLVLVMLILQVFLSVRGKILEDLFGGANLIRWHRTNGILIAFVAICHVALIIVPEGIDNLPIGKKYWPEMIGAVLFLLILLMVLSSHFRSTLKLDYKKWRTIHKPFGYLVVILVLIHVLFVSGSFERGAPRVVLLSVFTGLVLLVAVVKTLRWNSKL